MKITDRLTPKMERAFDYMLANPNFTVVEIAKVCEVHYNTAYNWSRSPVFIEEYKKRVNEKWAKAISTAQLQLIERVKADDWKAIQYILDSAGYNAAQKVELKSDTITINIKDENE